MQHEIKRGNMKQPQDVQNRVKKINELLADHIPPKDTWNPADVAVFQPVDLYRVPLEEAQDMQLKAIKYTFTHHYRNNAFYHRYCEMRNVKPDDIKNTEDLDKIPLIPDATYKQYPSGEEFARWLANVFTGDLPNVVIKGANPTYDEVINAFNAAGMAVYYSSGTSGRHTFIPRDQKTYRASQLALAKCRASMIDIYADHSFSLSPNPAKTNVFVGKLFTFVPKLVPNIEFAIDRELTTDMIKMAMSEKKGLKGRLASYVQNRTTQNIVDRVIQWLERYDNTDETIELSGMPFLLYQVMTSLQKDGKAFDFGETGMTLTGGGWKVNERVRIPHKDFRKLIQDVLGIPETRCVDMYGMVEGNGWMVQCPEGHYLHTPYTYYRPLVLDDNLIPVGYGEWGRFAFLDALAQSYSGFIISGDEVRLLEHCPVCDRPGPVLEPEIQRAEGEEVRGCAEEVRRVLTQDLTG